MTTDDISVVNFLRLVATMQSVFVTAATCVIIVRYIPILRSASDKPKRLLAWHIVGIGVSYVAANVALCVELLSRYDQPMTWRLPVDLLIFTSGDLALCLMIWRLIIMRKFYQLQGL